jgi:2,3-bisphosphoglycerate-independent phosphoglycerate mutase
MRDDSTGQPHTAHTSNPVPLIYAGRPAQCVNQGTLADIAPTILNLMDLPIPAEMSKHLLVALKSVKVE